MRLLIFAIFITYVICKVQASPKENDIVDLRQRYLNSTYNFLVPLYKVVAHQSNVNFAFAPRSVWIMLAAIAEGSRKETQQRLFELLKLPDDPFYRQKYYQLMTSSVVPVNGVSLAETRHLEVDENLNINPAWLNIVSENSLLNIVPIPMQYNSVFTETWNQKISNKLSIDLSGNSVLLNTVNFNGLWDTSFDNAIIENSPFYNQEGEEIGTVDLMRMKQRVRLGHIKSINAKVLELPVGSNAHYRMLFVILLEKKDIRMTMKNVNNDVVFEMFSSLKDTKVPIDIAIPRFKITSEIDMRAVIKDLGVTDLWIDPEATKYISSPPAFPTAFVQRVTATINTHGLVSPSVDQFHLPSIRTGSDSDLRMDFIANQPLLFGLFEAETFAPILAMGLSQPTTYKFGNTYLRKI